MIKRNCLALTCLKHIYNDGCLIVPCAFTGLTESVYLISTFFIIIISLTELLHFQFKQFPSDGFKNYIDLLFTFYSSELGQINTSAYPVAVQ